MTALVQQQQESSNFADPSLRHPVNMQQPEAAKNIHVYKNGDQHFPAKKFVVNKRHVSDFNSFLNMVTNGLKPSFGAVRNIYTPNYGHRVNELQDINNNMVIVAGGSERFRKLQYKDISAPKRQAHLRTTTTGNYDSIRPVYHNTRMNVAARWKDVNNDPCSIYVYENGDDIGHPVKVLLIPRTMKIWDNVLQEVTDKLAGHTRSVQAVRRLFTTEGGRIGASDQLQTGKYYVGVGNERFKHVEYGKRISHMTLMNSPRRPVLLPPIHTRARTLNSKPPSYLQQHADRKKMVERSQRSQPPPGASRHPPNRKLRPIRGAAPPPSTETESVFHAKPVKVKRSGASGKITAVSTMEENDDDIFRARRQPTKAEEVADDEDTKVDLPIDQVPADTVEEEEELDVPVKQNVEENRERTPTPETPKPTYATRLEEADTESSKSIKTPSSAKRNDEPQPSARATEEPEPTERSVQESETNGSAIHPEPEQTEKLPENKAVDENEAAVKIQARYRGYRTRRDFKQQKIVGSHSETVIEEDNNKSKEDVEKISRNSSHHSEKSPSSRHESPTNEQTIDQEQAATPQNPETPVTVEPIVGENSNTQADSTPTTPVVANREEDNVSQNEVSDENVNRESETPNKDPESTAEVPQNETEIEQNDPATSPPVKNDEEQSPPKEEEIVTTQQDPEVDIAPEQAKPESRPSSRESVNETTPIPNPEESPRERDDGDGIEENPAHKNENQENVPAENEPPSENGDKDHTEEGETERPLPITPIDNGEIAEPTPTKAPAETGPIPNGQPTVLE